MSESHHNLRFRNNKKRREFDPNKIRENKEQKEKNNDGFWEYSYNQRSSNIPKFILKAEAKEEKIKIDLKIAGGFDPKKIPNLMNPQLSREELIVQKLEGAQIVKLNSSEKLIYKNYVSKCKKAIDEDLSNLQKYGVEAKVNTSEGRKRKLMLSLERVLKSNNPNMVALIYLKLKDREFELDDNLRDEYSGILNKMEEIINGLDLVELQMTRLYCNQPPLNQKNFVELDDFQKDVINNIDNKISTIISAPTSSGKSVISGYAFTKGKALVVVPTDVLAWQMASYITDITGTFVPIITETFQSSPKRETLVEKVNNCNVVVGTADSLLDFLPLFNITFDWIVFDEIHMIGKEEGSSMEHIAKVYAGTPFLALSATIGNVDELKLWFEKLGNENISIVECNKRFFNLQRYIYLNNEKKLERLNPLGMIDIEDYHNRSVLNKSLKPTPPDIYDFALKICKLENSLNPIDFFGSDTRITLDMSNEYFDRILEKSVELFHNGFENEITEIIESYKHPYLEKEETDLIDMLFELKNQNKCPVIIFQNNSVSCMRLVRNFARDIEKRETEKYPNFVNEKIKSNKIARKKEKEVEKKMALIERKNSTDSSYGSMSKFEKNNITSSRFKKKSKQENKIDTKISSKEDEDLIMPEFESIQKPHPDFIFNREQIFSDAMIDDWNETILKRYFKKSDDNYHWLLIMLWRGIGVYVKGLPDDYLRLVQMLACTKKLAVIFSDISLVFGVSMPIRSVVVLQDPLTRDTLDPMLYHQMAGRAGRRGLDKEGNVIFAGYSWDRIKELSISKIPNITGMNNFIYPIDAVCNLSNTCENPYNWMSLKKNYLDTNLDDSESVYSQLNNKFGSEWNFVMKDNKNHQHMVWKLRKDIDCVIIPFILPAIKKVFNSNMDPSATRNQVDLAYVLLNFIHVREGDKYLLKKMDKYKTIDFNRLKNDLSSKGINIANNIDSKIYLSILENRLLDLNDEVLNNELRNDIYQFGEKLRCIQHYFFHSNMVNITRMLGKLLTRLWWICHTSSPLMKSWSSYES